MALCTSFRLVACGGMRRVGMQRISRSASTSPEQVFLYDLRMHLGFSPSKSPGRPPKTLLKRLIKSFSERPQSRSVYDDLHSNLSNFPVKLLKDLLTISTQRFTQLPNVLQLSRSRGTDGMFSSSLTVVGDVHGQYDDFAQIFNIEQLGGMPSAGNQFLFNGDIVDRGPMAIEILVVLLVSKLLCDESVHILRGNHESADCTSFYGFESEVKKKYKAEASDIYQQFHVLFNAMPVAAVIENEVFVTHGGLGGSTLKIFPTIEKMNAQDRSKESPFSDMLWSDPTDEDRPYDRSDIRPPFGPKKTKQFLTDNNLTQLIRSHEMRRMGYSVHHDNTCWTVFSAPNYCGQYGNLGAVIRYTDPASNQATVVQFDAAPKGVVGEPQLMPLSPLQKKKNMKKDEE